MKDESNNATKSVLSKSALDTMRQRARVIQLLDAAERASITPIRVVRLHAFAYLADVLSPVWDLPSFDGKILKIEGGPHYPDLQRELDRLVILGIAQVSGIQYIHRPNGGARVDGYYSLDFKSPKLLPILAALGAREPEKALDNLDCEVHSFLIELAGAVSTVPDDEVNTAATVDATYADQRIDNSNMVDFGSWTTDPYRDNLSQRTADRFRKFLPQGSMMTAGEKLYLYASFLGGRIHGR